MNRLLKFEFRKLFHHTSFYVCGIIVVVMALLNVYTLSMQEDMLDAFGVIGQIFQSENSGAKLMVMASENIMYTMLIPIMVSIFFCTDFVDGTIKNIIGRGFSRTAVYFSKVISSAVASVIYYFVGIVICTIYATILWGFGTFEGTFLFSLFVQAIGIMAFSTMCSLLSILFRKVGGALTLGIFAHIIINMICMVVDLMCTFQESEFRLTPYWLVSKVSEAATPAASMSTLGVSLLFCLGYGILFTVLGYLFFRKHEV